MRFNGKETNSNGVEIFSFSLGIEELKLLRGILRDSHERMPKITETMQVRSRLSNMRSNVEKTLSSYEKI